MSEIQAYITYYARNGFSRHLQTVCREVLKKRVTDPVLSFWYAYGLILEGSYSEAIRELDTLVGKREVEGAAPAALIYAHKQCRIVDEDAVSHFTMQLEMEEKNSKEGSSILQATFHWMVELAGKGKNHTAPGLGPDARKARELVERVLRTQPGNPSAQTLKGWMELTLEGGSLAKAAQLFDDVLSNGAGGPKDLDALLGKSTYFELKEQYGAALSELNHAVVQYPRFLPALAEKARLLMMTGDWDQALETSQRILAQDARNIEALRLTVLFLLSRESRYMAAASRLQDLLDSVMANEPRNANLCYQLSQPLARLCGRQEAVLKQTMALLERARQVDPDDARYLVEHGYQFILAGEAKSAAKAFQDATKLDELNIGALHGTIRCQILSGQLDHAQQQIEFLQDFNQSGDKSPELMLLSAMLAITRGGADSEVGYRHLDEAMELHMRGIRGKPISYSYFTALNPDLLLEMVRLYLVRVGAEPLGPTEPPNPYLSKASKVLEFVTKFVPGLLEAQLLLAKCRFLANDVDAAQRTCMLCLRLEPSFADAHVLLSQVYLHQGKLKVASQSLEQAMSHNFAVRESPTYHIVRARVLLGANEREEALHVLQAAMALPGIRRAAKSAALPAQKAKKGAADVSLNDRVTIFLLLAEVHNALGHVPEATKVIQDALNEFEGTPEEVRVTIANCDLALNRGDVEGALSLLNAIPRESPHYLKAKVAAADIHLKHRKDKAAYASCYLDLVNSFPDAQTQVLLGEAYMRIQEPELAIRAYEDALRQNPKNTALASRIGRALVMTHDFSRAIDYYEKAVRGDAGKSGMQLELAELYLKLRRFDAAERVLTECLERQRDDNDPAAMQVDVEALLLLGKVHKGSNLPSQALEAQQRARTIQNSLLGKMRGEASEIVRQQKMAAAEICFGLGAEYEAGRNLDKALASYNEALKHNDAHVKSMLALAKLHLVRGESDLCQQQCVALLRIDPVNEEGSIMLAELMFRKEHYETAIYHFQQLLERKPGHYGALVQLIHLLRRAGRMSEVPRYIRLAEKSSPRAHLEPGLHFVKGLHARLSNNLHEALRHYNMARKDGEWGDRATYEMVEVYLNPENDAVWDEASQEPGVRDNTESVRAAEKLLREARNKTSMRHQILECYQLMATKDKNDVVAALDRLMEMANTDAGKEAVPVLLAMATAFHMVKQTPKARNQLKRVQKMVYNAEEADEFERAWLMLADIYIQGNKFDLAQELCKKCLKYNKSCAKGWEYMGQIMEREQSYKDASDHYEKAWKFENEASPSVGYKLAFNYLKAKRYVEAIDVCNKVLAAYPKYPKIKKDILDKARQSLRP
eukprot:jgi/Mesvir1/26208/Mv02392-RA.1